MTTIKSANEISSVKKQATTLNAKLKEDTPKILPSFVRSSLATFAKEFSDMVENDDECKEITAKLAARKLEIYKGSRICEYSKDVASMYANYASKVYKVRFGCKMPEDYDGAKLDAMTNETISDTEARIISVVCSFNNTFEAKAKRTKLCDMEKIQACTAEIAEILKADIPEKFKQMSLDSLKTKYGSGIFEQANEQVGK